MSTDLEKSAGDSTPPSPSHDAGTVHNLDDSLTRLGYTPELRRNRSLFTLLFQSLAIAAIPFGVGGPLISSIYGGGQLSIFVGWMMVLVLNECIALSLSELASRYPTSAGPYYWSFQVAKNNKTLLSFITGWVWLIGNVSCLRPISSIHRGVLLKVHFGNTPQMGIGEPDVSLVFGLILIRIVDHHVVCEFWIRFAHLGNDLDVS